MQATKATLDMLFHITLPGNTEGSISKTAWGDGDIIQSPVAAVAIL